MKKVFPYLESDRFILRPFSNNDLENVFLGLSNPDVIKYYGISFDSLESTQEQIDWFKNLENENKGIWWAICTKEDKSFCGAGGLNDLDKTNRKAEIGFWLLREYWGRGIMTEIMPLICQYGFEKLELHRIEGFVDSKNENCKRALAKLDFNYEGTMVDSEIKNGEYISLDIYSILSKDENPSKAQQTSNQ